MCNKYRPETQNFLTSLFHIWTYHRIPWPRADLLAFLSQCFLFLIHAPPWNSKFWLLLPPWNSRFLYNQLFLILYCSSFPKSPLIRPKKLRGEYPKPIHNINVHRLITQRNRPVTQFLIHPYRPGTQDFYTISFF